MVNRPDNLPDNSDADVEQQCFAESILHEDVWRVLEQADIDWLNSVAVCRHYESGTFVFHQGDACKGAYIVRDGLIAVRKTSANGESTLLRVENTGGLMGYRPFLAGEPHRAAGEVMQSGTICLIPSPLLRELLLKKSEFGVELLKRVSRDLGAAEQRFQNVVTMSLRERLVHWLLLMKEPYGTETADGKILMKLPISRRDMAEMLGVRPESLSRTIRQMSEDGALRFSGHRVWINTGDRLIGELSQYLAR